MKKYVSLKQAAEVFSTNEQTIQKHAEEAGCLYKIGRVLRVDLEELREAFRKRKEE